MSVTVQGHQRAAVVFDGVGNQHLMIQTGTIDFDFHGSPTGEDWVRDRLTYTVLELPSDILPARIFATASAAPSSMRYSPPNYVRVLNVGGNTVPLIGRDNRPVTETQFKPGSVRIPLLGAGWAVDRTQATWSINKIQLAVEIQLAVDLAIFGYCGLMRLAYSVIVMIMPRTIQWTPQAREI